MTSQASPFVEASNENTFFHARDGAVMNVMGRPLVNKTSEIALFKIDIYNKK